MTGRPTKRPEDRREHNLCRVRKDERDDITAAAHRRHMSVPDYVMALHRAAQAPS